MMTEIGKVIEIKDGSTVVSVSRTSACEACAYRGACSSTGGAVDARIDVDNRIGAGVGDLVEIGVREGRLATASLIVSVLPILALFVGAGLGTFLAPMVGVSAGWSSVVMGLVFLAAGFGVVRLMDPYLSKKDAVRPRIVRIVEERS